MKRTAKKRPRSLRAMTIRLAAGILAVWLVCMVVTTLATAQMLFSALLAYSDEFAANMVISQQYQYEPERLWEEFSSFAERLKNRDFVPTMLKKPDGTPSG